MSVSRIYSFDPGESIFFSLAKWEQPVSDPDKGESQNDQTKRVAAQAVATLAINEGVLKKNFVAGGGENPSNISPLILDVDCSIPQYINPVPAAPVLLLLDADVDQHLDLCAEAGQEEGDLVPQESFVEPEPSPK